MYAITPSSLVFGLRRQLTLLAAAVLLAACFFVVQAGSPSAHADTQYDGPLTGKTYRNNYSGGFYHGVWADTTMSGGNAWIYVELQSQLYVGFGWVNEEFKSDDCYCVNVGVDDWDSDDPMRGWGHHWDLNSHEVWTSDGY